MFSATGSDSETMKIQLIGWKICQMLLFGGPVSDYGTRGYHERGRRPPCSYVFKISEPLQNGWAVLFC